MESFRSKQEIKNFFHSGTILDSSFMKDGDRCSVRSKNISAVPTSIKRNYNVHYIITRFL
jgi:hypothetical protein